MSAAAWVMIAGLSLWPFGDKSDDADVATIDSLDRQTPVLVEKDYFIADDIDIVRVRSRKLNCTCAPEESADSD